MIRVPIRVPALRRRPVSPPSRLRPRLRPRIWARIWARVWARVWPRVWPSHWPHPRPHPRPALLAVLLAACIAPPPAVARDHFVAALGATGATGAAGAADGSRAAPWPDLSTALAAAATGDRILLAPGRHGPVKLSRVTFDPPVTITSAPGGRAHLDRLEIDRAAGLTIVDLDIWPTPPAEGRQKGIVVNVSGRTSDIVLRGLDIRSAPGALDYASWDADTWNRVPVKLVQIWGADVTLADSTLTGGATALGIKGARARITGNEIRGFAKDGMRVFGAGTVVAGNTIRDCVSVHGNHDDGIQSWARRGNAPDEVVDITIAGNRILEWTGRADHPLRCRLQGIGLFNGPYRNWTIENNLIVARAGHGMNLGSVLGSRVVNNTIVSAPGAKPNRPWIQAAPDTLGSGTVIANNIAPFYRLKGPNGPGAARANVVLRYPHRLFEDPGALDFRPRAGSPILDSADPAAAPGRDIDGRARPQGAGPDHGAFERG